MNEFSVEGNIVDIINRAIFPGIINCRDRKILSIERINRKAKGYLLPGLIDAHVHIESSLLPPAEFARLAVVHGTVATVSDPHEIANVLGIEGVRFMIENGKTVPFKFFFGAPSCVPATVFETSGGSISVLEIENLLSQPEILYLSEMMNFPGVILNFPDVLAKLEVAKKFNKPVDGHAPGLSGEDLKKYFEAGISTDHECFSIEEALEKIESGMKILIREGSAAKNYSALHPLIDSHTSMVMLCSDDKHPDDLTAGHINQLVKRAIADEHDIFDVLRTATFNPSEHYGLNTGLLRIGDSADFIQIDNFEDFNVLKTFIGGTLVAENGKSLIEHQETAPVNFFKAVKLTENDLQIEPKGKRIRVIEVIEGELITNEIFANEKIHDNNLISDIENDILKIVVVNRYTKSKPSVAFIKNFGMKKGAIASSVAHDSHNIISVGTNDFDIMQAVNIVIEHKGGMSAADVRFIECLPLSIAGLMTNLDGYETAGIYDKLTRIVKDFGSELHAPFMTLSFMALLVIPALKLSDKGLFDGRKFEFTDLWVSV